MGDANGLERFGVDVGVKNFDSFKDNMERVEELMGRFSKGVPEFARSAGVFSKGLDKIGASISKQSAGTVNALASAYERLAKAIPKDIKTTSISAPRASATGSQKASDAATASAKAVSDAQAKQQQTNLQRVDAATNSLIKLIKRQEEAQFAALDKAFLKEKDHAAARIRIEQQTADAIANVTKRAGDLQLSFNETRLRSFRNTAEEIRKQSATITKDIRGQSFTAQPDVRGAGRSRLRTTLATLKDPREEFLGRVELAARSANPVVRTLAQTFFQVQDSLAGVRDTATAFSGIIPGAATAAKALNKAVDLTLDPAGTLLSLFKRTDNEIKESAKSAEKLAKSVRVPSSAKAAVPRAGAAPTDISGSLQRNAQAAKTATDSLAKHDQQLQKSAQSVGLLRASLEELVGSLGADLIVRSIGAITSGIASLGRQAVQALGDFEAMATSFNTLSLREVLDTQPALSFAEAQKVASEQAQELIYWNERLAIISPFSSEDVAGIFRMAQAYDFNSTEAKILTDVLTDFSAGTGQGADAAQNIALALGQVRAAGKLTGQELRQLTNNGVPALRILSEATGKSTEELNEFVKKGGSIEAEGFITALVRTLGTEFAGAAERSSGTVRGLISSLEDLKKIGLRELIQPVADEFAKPLAEQAISLAQSKEFQDQVKSIGKTAAEVARSIVNAVSFVIGAVQAAISFISQPVIDLYNNWGFLFNILAGIKIAFLALPAVIAPVAGALAFLLSPINLIVVGLASLLTAWQHNLLGIQEITFSFVDSVRTSLSSLWGQILPVAQSAFSQLASFVSRGLTATVSIVVSAAKNIDETFHSLITNMVSYGSNIVSALADGIVGAVGIVVQALSYLGSVVSSWLMPGSPPKLLPDLTKWGTGAADAWLEGWTKADFDLFTDLGDQISQALTAMGGNQSEPEIIAAVQKQVAAAVEELTETGSVSQSSIDKITKAAGTHAEEIGRISQSYINAAVATKRYDEAQKALNDATKKYADLLKPIDERLAAISNRQKADDETKQLGSLQNVIENRFATEEQKRKAALEIERISAEQQKRNLEAERDGVTENLQLAVDKAEAEKSAADDALEIAKKRFDVEFDLISSLNSAVGGAGDSMDAAGKKAKKLKEALGELNFGDDKLADLKLPQIDPENKLPESLKKAQDAIQKGKEEMTKRLTELRDAIVGPLKEIRDGFTSGFTGENGADTAIGKFAQSIGQAAAQIEPAVDAVQSQFSRLRGIFSQGFSGSSETGGKGEEQTQLTGISALVFQAGGLASKLKAGLDAITKEVTGFATTFAAEWEKAGKSEDGSTSIVDRFFTTINSASVQGKLESIKTNIIAEINRLFGSEDTTAFDWPAIGSRIKATLGAIVPDAGALKTSIIKTIEDLFGAEAAGSASDVIASVTTELDLLFGDVDFGDLTTSFANLKNKVVEAVTGIKWEDVVNSDIFSGLSGAVTSSIESIWGAITKALRGDAGGAGKEVSSGIARIGGELGKAGGGVVKAASGILSGLDIPSITLGLSAAVGTVLIGAIQGIPPLISETLKGLAATVEGADGEKTTLATQLGRTVTSAVAGIIAGAINGITKDSLITAVNATGSANASLGKILQDILSGIVLEAVSLIDQNTPAIVSSISTVAGQIEDAFASLVNSVLSALNTPIQAFNNLSPLVAGGIKIPDLPQIEIPVPLSADNFKPLAPNEIDISKILSITGQQVLDASQLVRIDTTGEKKVLLDARQIFSIDPSLREVVDPNNLIEVNGEQKLIVYPSQIVETDDSVRIKITATDVIELDKSTPLEVSSVNVASDAFKVDLTKPIVSLSEELNKSLADTSASLKIDPKINESVNQSLLTGDTGPFPLPVTPSVTAPLSVTDLVTGIAASTAIGGGSSGTLSINVSPVIDPLTPLAPIGTSIQEGIAQGITTAQSTDTTQKDYQDKLAKDWDIKSPSGVADIKIGQPIGLGIIQGVQTSLNAGVLDYSKLFSGETGGGDGQSPLNVISIKVAATIGAINLSATDQFKRSLGGQVASILNDMAWEDDITSDIWKNLIDQTVLSLNDISWEQDLQPETWYDTLTPWVETTMREIEWQNFIFPATWTPMARVVEATMKAISWASYIKNTTWDPLAKRIAETIADIEWDRFINPDLFEKLAAEVADAIAHINWGDFVSGDDLGGLVEAVDNAINDINWDSRINADDFDGVAEAIIQAIIDAINRIPGNSGGGGQEPPVTPGQPFSRSASALADSIDLASQGSRRRSADRAALREEAKRAIAERGARSGQPASLVSANGVPTQVEANVTVNSPLPTQASAGSIGGSVTNEFNDGGDGDSLSSVGSMLAAIGASLVRTNNRLLDLSGGSVSSASAVTGGVVSTLTQTPLIQAATNITNNFNLYQTVTPPVASRSATSFVGLRTIVGA